jgi:hypothetical protein
MDEGVPPAGVACIGGGAARAVSLKPFFQERTGAIAALAFRRQLQQSFGGKLNEWMNYRHGSHTVFDGEVSLTPLSNPRGQAKFARRPRCAAASAGSGSVAET